MKSKISYLVTLFFCLLLPFYSCKKDGTSDEFQTLDLNIQFNQNNSNYECNWTETNISTFERSYLVYSATPIPENYDPSQGFMPTIYISDPSQNSCNIQPTVRSYKTYFRLYVDIGNRFIKSDVVEFIDPSWQSINIVPDRLIHFPEKNAIYIFEYATQRLVFYDYEEKKVKKETVLDYAFEEAKTGSNGLGDELYLIHDNFNLSIFDANTLEEKETINFGEEVFSVDSNNKGLLAVSTNDEIASVKILQRSDLSIVNTFDFSDHAMRRGIAFLSKEDNKFVETGKDNLHLYVLGESGELVSHISKENPYQTAFTNTDVTVSPNGNYFVNTRYGEFFKANLDPLGRLNGITDFEFLSYYFPSNQNRVYAIRKGTELTYKYSFPALESPVHFSIYQINPVLFFTINGQQMMVAKDCSKLETIIQPFYF